MMERINMGGIQQCMNNGVVNRVKALSLPERRPGRNKMTETEIYVSCVRIVQRSDELRRLTFRDPLKLLRGEELSTKSGMGGVISLLGGDGVLDPACWLRARPRRL